MRRLWAACLVLLLLSGTASAAEHTLRFAHFMPANSPQDSDIFQAWAQAVATASNGRIDVRVYPAQTLGKAASGYDNARSGIADVVWTVQGYTANRFPLSQIAELPGLFERAEVGSCALQKLYESGVLDAEYTETRVLFLHTHGPGHLHTADRPVTELADFEGLRIRRPTAVIGRLLEALGAEPVGMPAPQIYESMARGAIDGFMLPWEAVKAFRAGEVADHHTDFGLYALAFATVMNKAAYDRLPADLKAVIDAHSGLDWARRAGRVYDRADVAGLDYARATGTVHSVDLAERARWAARADAASRAYIDELESRGLPAQATYRAFQAHVADCRTLIAGP